MLVVAAIVDQKWLKRLEQQLSGLVETSSTVPLLAHDASQFLEDEIAAGESSRRNFRNFSTVVSAPAILGLPESSPSA
jgi:DICT domain-containing protein